MRERRWLWKGKGWREKSYMGSRRWEDRKKGSGKERWMWRMCEGETEMGQREKHRGKWRGRRSQRMKRRNSSVGFLWVCQAGTTARLTLLPYTVAIRTDPDMFPLHLLVTALSPKQPAQLAFLVHLWVYLWDKGWVSCTVPEDMHPCVPSKYESVSVYYND